MFRLLHTPHGSRVAVLHNSACTPPASRLPSGRQCDRISLARPLRRAIGLVATVLIVDDEPLIVELVRFTLEDEHVRVVEAGDGVEALDVARAELPDLVFLDVQMPYLNGFQVCRRLRQEPRLAKTRIVMLTAAGQEQDLARGRAAGADLYLTKPFSPLRLLTLVQSLLPEAPLWPER